MPVADLPEEDATGDENDIEDTVTSSDPPPPASRHGKRNSAISKLSNQVKALELNLQVTNRLEISYYISFFICQTL